MNYVYIYFNRVKNNAGRVNIACDKQSELSLLFLKPSVLGAGKCCTMEQRVFVWMGFNAVSTKFQLYTAVSYPITMLPGILTNCTPHKYSASGWHDMSLYGMYANQHICVVIAHCPLFQVLKEPFLKPSCVMARWGLLT